MLSGITSGLVLLLFASAVIERWLRTYEEKQWSRVAATAFMELAGQLLREHRLLRQLIGLGEYDDRAARPPISDVESAELRRIVTSIPQELDTIAGRLDVLSDNAEWARIAYVSIQRLQDSARNVVSRWAPVMITSDRLSAVLTEVTTTIDGTNEIQIPLIDFVRRSTPIADVGSWSARWAALMSDSLEVRKTLTDYSPQS